MYINGPSTTTTTTTTPLVRFMTPEDSFKLLEYISDLILDRYSRGYADTLVRVRACL